ncbi:BsuPI-related putative proteinase inhibitor [Kangiella geojedonensis]|uniref:Intracellular proteinase inhibitor BsuPI domain-containing protein n=1 Tax=Kangiella geojedonensis TaxID=914150 RepID=A0A0F6RCZ2_9GAMM|nr:BsuPI-related putative proteinase inhibitor [Kangiella geojedonensis]AKE52476.1 hypothetical protein TQ33_1529 [Kangiella geojedonensis]
MNVYQKITLGLATMLSGAVSADNFVMTSPTDYRSYKSSQGEVISVGLMETMGANWKQYSSYFGQENQWLWVSHDGNRVYWLNESQQLDLLFDGDDPVGTEYQVRIDGCTDRAVLAGKEANLSSSAGDFNDLVKLDFTGYCFDAGLKSAWFAPGIGLVKWAQDSVLGVVEFELEHAKVDRMTLPNQNGIELSAQFPAETVMLNQQKNVETSITLINHSDQTLTLDFTSGQTFEIYLYDDQGELVSLWSSDMMFTQALHSMDIKPGAAERFGGELELKDLDGQPLDIGSYKIKIEIKGNLSPEASSFSHIPLSSESVLHLDNMMTHY